MQPLAHQTFDTNVETVLRPRPPPESTAICFFLHFCQWRQKVHSPLTNTAFFSNCSGLLRCIKHGPANSQQFSPLPAMCVHALASENMDLQVVGCMDQTRLRYEIKTKTKKFILEIVKIRRSPYVHFNFTNLRINMDILSPMHIYICICAGSPSAHTPPYQCTPHLATITCNPPPPPPHHTQECQEENRSTISLFSLAQTLSTRPSCLELRRLNTSPFVWLSLQRSSVTAFDSCRYSD